ncbi:MAG: hypothetical protein M3290_04305, partial [Actinomycetota bacterium]|nr:hypothetical protein [Actinomycetota bacterium]
MRGVQFAEVDGQRSSQRAGKSIFAEAAAGVDDGLARSIAAADQWRKRYVRHVRDLVAAGARSSKDALRIAADGLSAADRALCFATDDGDLSLREALELRSECTFQTREIAGTGPRVRELQVPYKGGLLAGDDLLQQLDRWQASGVLEPSCRSALEDVVRHPEWLDLSDRWFVLLGAASEMGPLEVISRWGANIIAVELPRRHLQEHIARVAEAGSGHTFIPVAAGSDGASAGATGADLLVDLPLIASWIRSFDSPLTVGNYVYADGATFVRVEGAADALVEHLVQSHPQTSLAYLATPTDVFAVPHELVSDATDARGNAVVRRGVGAITLGKLFTPTYGRVVGGEDRRKWGIADALVPIQGANYALAKAMQRWRAMVAREEGTIVSAIVAPATRTRSVTKNRLLAAAYRGAGAFGVEIFEPDTCRALTAALLVRDLRDPSSASHP